MLAPVIQKNDKQAKFIANVGKKTAPFTKAKGTLNVFPQTMDVTPATPNN